MSDEPEGLVVLDLPLIPDALSLAPDLSPVSDLLLVSDLSLELGTPVLFVDAPVPELSEPVAEPVDPALPAPALCASAAPDNTSGAVMAAALTQFHKLRLMSSPLPPI